MCHQNSVVCSVGGCNHSYMNIPSKKREHYEMYHELECDNFGWTFKPHIVCSDVNCGLCEDLLESDKPRYATNKASSMKRHKNRAASRRDPTKRVKCLVLTNGVPCTKTFSVKDGLQKHLCGLDGVTTGRCHSVKDIKKAYPKIRNLTTRKRDASRTLGKTHRSFSNSQKLRTVKKSRKRRRPSLNFTYTYNKYKKARRDQVDHWIKKSKALENKSSKISDQGRDRRNRSRMGGGGKSLAEPIKSNQLLLQKIAMEMTENFEHVGYWDIARNFEMELELKHPPFDWTIDPENEDRDQELKKRRVQYYFTKHVGNLKPSV